VTAAWAGEVALQAWEAHPEVTEVAVLKGEVDEASAAAGSLHPYDLVSHVACSDVASSDHVQKNVGVVVVAMTASKAFAVAVGAVHVVVVVSSYFGSVLVDEADSEVAALADVAAADLLGEEEAAAVAALVDFDRHPCWRAWHRKRKLHPKNRKSSRNRGLLKDCERGDHKHPFEPVALPVHGCWQPSVAVAAFAEMKPFAVAFAEGKPDSGSRANQVAGWDSSLAWMKNYVSLGEMIAYLDQTALPD